MITRPACTSVSEERALAEQAGVDVIHGAVDRSNAPWSCYGEERLIVGFGVRKAKASFGSRIMSTFFAFVSWRLVLPACQCREAGGTSLPITGPWRLHRAEQSYSNNGAQGRDRHGAPI